MEFQDKTIACKDCHGDFVLTAGEQDFFTSKSLNMPGRCKACRAQRKAERDGGQGQPAAGPAPNVRPQVVEPPPPGRRHGGGPRADSRGRGGRRDYDD